MKTLLFFSLLSFKLICCDDINLYTDKDFNTKIKHQGDMHTCYAHSLSALYEKDEIHPYWIAFTHKDRLLHWTPHNLNFSLLSWSYSDVKKRGLCDKNLIDDSIKEALNGIEYSNDQFFYFLQSYFLKEKDPKKLESFLKKNSHDFSKNWNSHEINELVSTIEKSNDEKLFDYLENNIFKRCQNNKNISGKLHSTARAFESNTKLAKVINGKLKNLKPLSIGLCAKKTYKKSSAYNKNLKPRILKAASSKCGAHYVNIVGSRKKDNTCEYLIRNSYKNKWAHKKFECFCQDKNGEKFNCKTSSIEKGTKILGCWISKERILNNTYDLSYF